MPFFPVTIPSLRLELSAYAPSAAGLVGRTVKADLSRIARKPFLATFTIERIKDESSVASFKRLSLPSTYVQRLFKRRVSYVEDSFIAKAKDGRLKIKPLLITPRKVHRRIRKALREIARKALSDSVATKDSEAVFVAVVQGRLQSELAKKARKVYPLSVSEIRVLERAK